MHKLVHWVCRVLPANAAFAETIERVGLSAKRRAGPGPTGGSQGNRDEIARANCLPWLKRAYGLRFVSTLLDAGTLRAADARVEPARRQSRLVAGGWLRAPC